MAGGDIWCASGATLNVVTLLQVTVLDVLDQESALHLLPSLREAPDCGRQPCLAQTGAEQGSSDPDSVGDEPRIEPTTYNCKDGAESMFLQDRPKEAVDMFRRLLHEGRLRKAAELGSLTHEVAALH